MNNNISSEKIITNILNINNDTTTVLLRCEDNETEEWFDALYNGWLVTYAIYDEIYYNTQTGEETGEVTKSCGGYFAHDPQGFNDECPDTLIVPTMFCGCNGNKTRMEAFVEKHKKGEWDIPMEHVKYRCPRCKTKFALNTNEQESEES